VSLITCSTLASISAFVASRSAADGFFAL